MKRGPKPKPRKINLITEITFTLLNGWLVYFSVKRDDATPKAALLPAHTEYTAFILGVRGAMFPTKADHTMWTGNYQYKYLHTHGKKQYPCIFIPREEAADELAAYVLAQPILDEINKRWPHGYNSKNGTPSVEEKSNEQTKAGNENL